MKINFYIGRKKLNPKSKFFDWVICWWTHSNFSHVEVEFPDGISFSSSPRDNGSRFKYIKYDPQHWITVEVSRTEEEIAAIKEFCNNQV